MQPPPRRRVDRAVAAIAFGLAAAALLVATALGSIGLPLAARRDPRAAAELVELMRRGEHATFVADYGFTRTNARGQQFASRYAEARDDRFHVTRSGSSLTIETSRLRYDCELVSGEPSCRSQSRGRTLPPSEVLRVAVAIGAYDVIKLADRTIAGEHAECFRVRAPSPSHTLEGFGRESDVCFAADGIPLSTSVVRPAFVEERLARQVVRTFDADTIAPLLSGFDQTAPAIGN